jgi:hypothetical protein
VYNGEKKGILPKYDINYKVKRYIVLALGEKIKYVNQEIYIQLSLINHLKHTETLFSKRKYSKDGPS